MSDFDFTDYQPAADLQGSIPDTTTDELSPIPDTSAGFEPLPPEPVDITDSPYPTSEAEASPIEAEGRFVPVEAPAGLTMEDVQDLQWVTQPNGDSSAYAADGSLITISGDTDIVTVNFPDGGIMQLMPDGSAYKWVDGEGITVLEGPQDDYSDTGTDADTGTDTGFDDAGIDTGYVDTEPEVDAYGEPEENLDVAQEWDGVYGNSYAWHFDWFYQEVDGYCGPTSVAIIANEFLGAEINNPEYMVDIAYQLGLTEDISQGMYTSDICSLLNAVGVPAEVQYSSMEDLAMKLEAGYGVLATVDAGEIWGEEADQYFEDNVSDHALVVAEINVPEGVVILADPGNPDGDGFRVPIDTFADAWQDSGYEMIVTLDQDPDLIDEDLGAPAYAGGSMAENSPNFALVNLSGQDGIK